MFLKVVSHPLSAIFQGAHQVNIVSTSEAGSGCLLLVNVWMTDHYRSIQQHVLCYQNGVFTCRNHFDTSIRWKSIHAINETTYVVGSDSSMQTNRALLRWYAGDQQQQEKAFAIDLFPEIGTIANTIDGNLLIKGVYYQRQQAGSHDEFVPHGWQVVLSSNGNETDEYKMTPGTQWIKIVNDKDTAYYIIQNDTIRKYTSNLELLWDQQIDSLNSTNRTFLRTLISYSKGGEQEWETDGIWIAGHAGHYERSSPYLGRVTSGGTLLDYSHLIAEVDSLTSICEIVEVAERDCLLIGNTLKKGSGAGLCAIYLRYKGMKYEIDDVRYLNILSASQVPAIESEPHFTGLYGYPLKACLVDGIQIPINIQLPKGNQQGLLWHLHIS